MDDPDNNQELQSFLERNAATGATSDEIAKLDDHVEKNPRRRPIDRYTKVGVGLVVGFVIVRFVIRAIFG